MSVQEHSMNKLWKRQTKYERIVVESKKFRNLPTTEAHSSEHSTTNNDSTSPASATTLEISTVICSEKVLQNVCTTTQGRLMND